MLRQVGDGLGRAVAGEIIRRGNEFQTAVKQMAGAQGGVVQAACADGDVHAPLDEVDVAFGRSEQQRHLRVAFAERAHQRGDEVQQRGRGGIHPKHALRRAACGEDFGLGGFDVVQYLPRALEKAAAFFGEPQLTRGTVEQVGGEFVFQPLHGAADGGVGQPEPLCRAAETAAFHHLHKHGQFVRMGFHCCVS